jgi:hypothetical protein
LGKELQMKNIFIVLVVFALMVPVASYAGKYDDVLVQADGNCSKPCVVIGHILVKKAWVVGSCANKIRKEAKKKYNADAVLKYEVESRGKDLGDQCKGIAVRWAKDGEAGVTRVTDDTPIPVID